MWSVNSDRNGEERSCSVFCITVLLDRLWARERLCIVVILTQCSCVCAHFSRTRTHSHSHLLPHSLPHPLPLTLSLPLPQRLPLPLTQPLTLTWVMGETSGILSSVALNPYLNRGVLTVTHGTRTTRGNAAPSSTDSSFDEDELHPPTSATRTSTYYILVSIIST